MKIPETTANVGAYYGNEENGQWQPNGVIIDSGVGGGVVGSGDAGLHRPVYPVHMPRSHAHIPGPHGTTLDSGGGVPGSGDPTNPMYPVHMPRVPVPGYVMAGAYYPPAYPTAAPAPPDDFADYMWMENEEEFDKQVMQQLEEEALMEQCIEAMLEDEQRERHRPTANGHKHHYPTTSNGGGSLSLEETVSRSTLNPLAAEFVPTGVRPPPPPPPAHTENKPESPPETTSEVQKEKEEPAAEEIKPEESKTEEPVTPNPEPPEVSAADIQPRREKKTEVKKTVKQEPKKMKPQVVKSDTKVQVKKKEVKTVKSEVKVDEKTEEVAVEAEKPQPSPAEEPTQTGPKPINYAAAAKANKPKKPPTPPATDKTTPPLRITEKKLADKIEKKKVEKPAVKPEKPVQRKNSTK